MNIEVSNKIELKLLHISDASDLYKLVDANREHLREWLSWLDDTNSEEVTLNFIQQGLKKFLEKKILTLGIYFEGKLVGMIDQHDVDFHHKKTRLGYWLSQDHEGQGIMTEACKALINHVFDDQNLNRIEIRTAVKNKRSQKIPESLGFKKEGIARQNEWLYDHFVDHQIYSLLKEEWDRQSPKKR